MKSLGEGWKHCLNKGAFGWEFTDRNTGEKVEATPAWVIKHYFYGYLFHVDDQKLVAMLEEVQQSPLQWAFFRGRIHDSFANMAVRLGELGQVVRHVLEHGAEPAEFFVYGVIDERWARFNGATGEAGPVDTAPPPDSIRLRRLAVASAIAPSSGS